MRKEKKRKEKIEEGKNNSETPVGFLHMDWGKRKFSQDLGVSLGRLRVQGMGPVAWVVGNGQLRGEHAIP